MKTKNPTKKRKENCENHGEQRIEADLCTGDLESNQSTLELQVQATEEKGGREGKREGRRGGKAHSSLALDHFTLSLENLVKSSDRNMEK